MEENYTVYHIHSDTSNPTAGTGADSVTKYKSYLDLAQEQGMKSFGFSEHGSLLNWIEKKQEIEKRGMKYIHANEAYLTQHIDRNKGLIRDNFHYMMIAKNFDGVKELNQLTSDSYNREDGHFYFNPRISFDELKGTSDNILMTSACLASPIWRLYKNSIGGDLNAYDIVDKSAKRELDDLLVWMGNNKHRMFFEIQYHSHPEQIAFNQMLLRLSRELDIPLIAGTDTHALNAEHAGARELFLKSKNASYGNSDAFDLTFKSYDELVGMFEKQNALPRSVYLEAIHNTNVMADMVEEFELDRSHKYPKVSDNPIEVFKKEINKGVKKRGINKFPKEKREKYFNRIDEEFNVFVKLGTVNYMLLQKDIIDWCHKNDIYQGFGRGSSSGSIISYILGITDMDSVKHNLNFSRFMNPDRVSLADIDIDFPSSRRQEVIDYVSSIEGIDFAEIITYNTLAMRGAIRIAGRGLEMSPSEIDEIAKSVETFNGKDRVDKKYKSKYPELFKYVELLNGVIESMGSHPSGFIVSPIDLDTNISTLYTKESKYRVTAVNMNELDGQNYVKLDMLGLDNIELINETCKLAGIERITPDNTDIDDLEVWGSMRKSTLGIFQMESKTAQSYVAKMFSEDTLSRIEEQGVGASFIDMLSMANGAIRPAGSSYRDALANGEVYDNGHEALNDLLKNTLGYCIFQEQIMQFLTDFCEHTGSESDTVRRGFAKKTGTQQYLPKIEKGFLHYMVNHYGETEENAQKILQSFLKIIEDASDYGFSINHSQPYSYMGYIGTYLRHYYPLEFLTTALNIWEKKEEKTSNIIRYAQNEGIDLKPITFGESRASYTLNHTENSIYKGIASIKFLNRQVAEELYELAHKKDYDKDKWVDLLVDIVTETSANAGQMEVLIRLDFFREFGEKEVLLEIYLTMIARKVGDGKPKKANFTLYPEFDDKVEMVKVRKRNKITKKMEDVFEEKVIKTPLKYDPSHIESTREKRLENLYAYEKAVKSKPPRKIELYEQIAFEKENLGYAVSTFPNVKSSYALVLDINKKFTPWVTLYKISNGTEISVKVAKKKFWANDKDLLVVGDIVQVIETHQEYGWKYVDKEFKRDKSKLELHLDKVKIIRHSSRRNIDKSI